jgi:hypothetical protein
MIGNVAVHSTMAKIQLDPRAEFLRVGVRASCMVMRDAH